MRSAECHEPIGVMIAAFFAWSYVVHVQERPMLAAGNDARAAIAAQHLSAHRRRRRLGRSSWHRPIAGRLLSALGRILPHGGIRPGRNPSNVLPIALRHLDHFRRDFDPRGFCVLLPAFSSTIALRFALEGVLIGETPRARFQCAAIGIR